MLKDQKVNIIFPFNSPIVIYEAEVSWVIFLPSSNNSKKFIEVVDVVFLKIKQ